MKGLQYLFLCLQAVWTGNTEVSRQFAAGRGKLLNRYYYLRKQMRKVKLIDNDNKSRRKVPRCVPPSLGNDGKYRDRLPITDRLPSYRVIPNICVVSPT